MSPALSVTACHDEAARLWADYATAIGLEALHDAYGPHWPRPAIAGEQVWSFTRDGAVIAWGSILHDPAERLAWHAHGVWPAFQDQAATREISRFLTDWAFEHLPIQAVCAKILETNPRYQAYFRRRQHDPAFAWRYAGTITMPWPGYDVYCFARQRWQLERDQVQPSAEDSGNSRPSAGSVRDMSG